MVRRIFYSLLFLLFAAYCVGYLGFVVMESVRRQAERNGTAETRAIRAAKGIGPIKIGAAAHWQGAEGPAMWNALSLAANEINSGAGAAGRKILLVRKDDEGTAEGARRAAQLLADDPEIVAVIGHGDSDRTLAASLIYDHYGVLLMSPSATAMKLTRGGGGATFRMPPGEERIARTLADYCVAQGLKRVMILYEAGAYGQGMANEFEKLVDERGLVILDRIPYEASGGEAAVESDLANWKRYYRFDAILLAGTLSEAAKIVALTRKGGVGVPILAGCELDSPALIEQAGAGAEGVIVASVFDAAAIEEPSRAAMEALKARLGGEPSWRAVYAHDALKLLAAAIEAKKSAAPEAIAGELRSGPERAGIAGRYRFNAEGDSLEGAVGLKVVKDGKFERLAAPPAFVAPPAEAAAP